MTTDESFVLAILRAARPRELSTREVTHRLDRGDITEILDLLIQLWSDGRIYRRGECAGGPTWGYGRRPC